MNEWDLIVLTRIKVPAHASAPLAVRGLPPAKGLGGTRPDLWSDFSFKLTSYLSVQEPDFGELMDRAARDFEVITGDRLTRLAEAGEGTLDLRYVRMSRRLRYLLALLCRGAPLTIIRTANIDNGFEIWRLLSQRYAPNLVASHAWYFGATYLSRHCPRLTSKMLLHTGRQRLPNTNVKLVLSCLTQ